MVYSESDYDDDDDELVWIRRDDIDRDSFIIHKLAEFFRSVFTVYMYWRYLAAYRSVIKCHYSSGSWRFGQPFMQGHHVQLVQVVIRNDEHVDL